MRSRFGLVLLSALALAACGGQTAADSSPATSAAAASTAASAAAKTATSSAASGAAKPAASAAGSAAAKPAGSAAASAAAKPAASAATASGAASGAAKPAASGTAIKIAYSQPAAAFAAVWTADSKGLFAKYGLNAQVLKISPPADVQAVVSGDVQFTVDGSSGVPAYSSGANITYIGSPVPYFTQSLFAQKSISKVSDLLGKTIAATTQGGSSDNALKTLLAKENVDLSKVNITYLRDDSAILAAISGGTVAAAILTSPNTLRARESGLNELVYMPPLKLNTINNGLLVRKDWAQQHEDVVLNFLRAYLEAIKEVRTNVDGTKAIISKYTDITDQAQLDDSYKTASGAWVPVPLISDPQVQNVIDLALEPSVKTHKPSEFYDNSYLQKLDSFIKTLYPDGVPSL